MTIQELYDMAKSKDALDYDLKIDNYEYYVIKMEDIIVDKYNKTVEIEMV